MSLSQDSSGRRRQRVPLSADEEHCIIIIKVREFSRITPLTRGNIESQEKLIDCEVSNSYFRNCYSVLVYPNIYDGELEECISIVLCRRRGMTNAILALHVELTSMLAIIDADVNTRFRQWKKISYDTVPTEADIGTWNLHFDHVKRSHLLDDPTQWLPDDILTLRIDATLRQNRYHHLEYDFQMKKSPKGVEEWYLLLNSSLAKRLAEESGYFKHLQVTPMVEKSSGCVRIPGDEYEWFRTIGRLLLDGGPVTFESIDEIFNLYTIADKYCIALIMEDCRSWLELCLSPENEAEISMFADQYGDDRLKAFLRRTGRECHAKGYGAGSGESEKWMLTRKVGEAGYCLEYRLKHATKSEEVKMKAIQFLQLLILKIIQFRKTTTVEEKYDDYDSDDYYDYDDVYIPGSDEDYFS